MPVGQAIDKATIDAQVASLPRQLNSIFNQIQLFTQHLDAVIDATLTALGYSGSEITLLRSAYRDMDKLRQVAQGLMYITFGATANTGTPTANDATHFGYDFRTFTKQIDGIGY